MNDRYIKSMLTVIACALVYLCLILTPWPGVSAQVPSAVPGVSSGPSEVVIVGFRQTRPWDAQFALPVAVKDPIQIIAARPVEVTGRVTALRASDRADRVVIAGWEEEATRESSGRMRTLPPVGTATNDPSALPVKNAQ